MSRQASGDPELSTRIAEVMAIDPSADAIEFDRTWWTWGQLGETARQVAKLVEEPGGEVAIVLRNHPVVVAALAGVLMAEGCAVAVNPGRGVSRTRDDIAALAPSIVLGRTDDLAELVPDHMEATCVGLGELGGSIEVRDGGRQASAVVRQGVAVRMLTSGTTGPPKRVDLAYSTFERVLVGAKHYESDRRIGGGLRTGVAVVNAPLAHVGGLFRVLQCIVDGRPFCLLERFTVEGWVDAVRRHRPKTASLVPAALRMVLEAALDPGDLSSLRSVVSGTAPLDADDADRFHRTYGVPVLISYGATEFAGGVAGWTVQDHDRYWETKKGSVGRAHPGCELRVVDPESGEVLGVDEPGLLEVKASQRIEDGWIRTTDLARLDGDGFLWILGRADEAIIRGGFKILPDDVRVALERHRSVKAAAVVGRADRRLGAVPVAIVELWPDAEPVGEQGLLEHLRPHLAPYELPAEIRVLAGLPRTASGKVDLHATREAMRHPVPEVGTEGPGWGAKI